MTINFLSVENVLAIHGRQLDVTGGLAGVRDRALLESAVATPQAAYSGQFLHRDLAEMAAAYLFHLCKNHPFFDGNKRVAAAVAVVFVEANGQVFEADQDEFAEMVLQVARGTADKPAIAQFFRDHLRPV